MAVISAAGDFNIEQTAAAAAERQLIPCLLRTAVGRFTRSERHPGKFTDIAAFSIENAE
jgi:hypothetical protein